MPESPTTLTYPLVTSADQYGNGGSIDATTKQWVPSQGAVTLAAPSAATRDPGNVFECQLSDGTSAGFDDTTYTLTAGQVAAGSLMGA